MMRRAWVFPGPAVPGSELSGERSRQGSCPGSMLNRHRAGDENADGLLFQRLLRDISWNQKEDKRMQLRVASVTEKQRGGISAICNSRPMILLQEGDKVNPSRPDSAVSMLSPGKLKESAEASRVATQRSEAELQETERCRWGPRSTLKDSCAAKPEDSSRSQGDDPLLIYAESSLQ